MGNQQTTAQQYQSRFNSKYQFISITDDPNFGQIKVYRKKQLNFDYVMVLQKYVTPTRIQQLTNQIKKIHAAFLTSNEPMALRIFNYDVLQDNWSECKVPMIRLYVEYFNYTLHDLIKRHEQKGDSFCYDEIIYIVWSIVETYQYFSRITRRYLTVNSKSIYLSTEGCIKFSPIKAEDFFQQDNALCKAVFYDKKNKEMVNFERGQKYILIDIRNILKEISHLNFRNSEQAKITNLIQTIKKVNTIETLRKVIGVPAIQALNLSKKEDHTAESISIPTNKSFKSGSPSQEGEEVRSVKLSIKKHYKPLSQPQIVSLRKR